MWHTFKRGLEIYKNLVGNIECIVDVGVQHKTDQLIDVFPNSYHYLFEPANVYHEIIEKNYSKISHELIKCAVSSKSDILFQHLISQDMSGKVSHSHLRATSDRIKLFEKMYVDIVPTKVVTLDDYFKDKTFASEFNVLKIDVDGEDTNVMLGARSFVENIGLMIVECPTNLILERIGLAHELGFEIWDIVSPGYYYDQLSQVDVFFINKKIKKNNINFNPWRKSGGVVIWEHWLHMD